MRIDRPDFKDYILEVSDKFDEEEELEIDILNPFHVASIWLTKDEVKLLVTHLIQTL